jgi:YkoY family integral membrane protein
MEFIETIEQLIGQDWQSGLLVVMNLIIIESLLSVDNAAVLATMVMPLPENERKKALRIGLILAYVLRGTCLVLASFLIQIKWLKLIGGLYLFGLAVQHFTKKTANEDELPPPPKKLFGVFNQFWSTVLMVETMDLMFSIDNVFAAVAFTKNIYLICLGVFIGIIAMRTVAVYFVKLMSTHPQLGTAAFIVIAILGLKLILEAVGHYYPNPLSHAIETEIANLVFSLSTILIFVVFVFLPTFNKKPD